MASGILATADLVANTDTLIYTVPAGVLACFNVNVCNRGSHTIMITLYLTNGAAPVVGDAIEFAVNLIKNGVLERTGLVLGAGQKLYAKASAVSVSVNVYGVEEAV